MQKKDMEKTGNIKHRVITMLDRNELEFLDKLGKDALFTTGHKLSYNEILRALIDFSKEVGLTAENVDSDETLKRKLFEQIRNGLTKGEER